MANDLDDLRRLLGQERARLAAGDFGDLTAMASEKERLMARLESQPPGDLRKLRALMAEAQSNQASLAAALKGVQSAQARLKAIMAAQSGLSAYTADGRTVRHETRTGTFERRA